MYKNYSIKVENGNIPITDPEKGSPKVQTVQ